MSFVTVYFANVIHFSKMEILYLLTVMPFFSRLVRPVIYFCLRPKIDLVTLNFLSLLIIVLGFLIMGMSVLFWLNLTGLAVLSTGQGLYRISLRRDLAEDGSETDPSAIRGTSKFVLSYVVAPVLSYPLGFYALNLWPNGGIIYLALILLLPALLPFVLTPHTNSQKENIARMPWHSLLDRTYLKMFFLTFLMMSLTSSLIFCAPFILYKGGTTIPAIELVAMTMSGATGVFSRWIIKIKEETNIVIAALFFVFAPLLLLYGHIHDMSSIRSLAIVLKGQK